MTDEQKLGFVESQVRAARRGATNTLKCPYCDGSNNADQERMCCPTFIKAVAAVLDRMDLEETQEMVERIAEGNGRVMVN
jgi:hypothetical protein